MTPFEQDNRKKLVYKYLEEFRKFGDLLATEQFDHIVADELGLDAESPEFLNIQAEAEELIRQEMDEWIAEHNDSTLGQFPSDGIDRGMSLGRTEDEPTRAISKPRAWGEKQENSDEEVHYVNVDFANMEDEDSPDVDASLSGKRLDIQVYHVGKE